MEYSENAMNVFKRLYFVDGETKPEDVFWRVAAFAASAEETPELRVEWEQRFFDEMNEGRFRPNSPAMMNGGIDEKAQTSACFVGHMEDDFESILDFDKSGAMVFKSGSGMGINFGELREDGAALSSGGQSSGPFSFMRRFATTGEAVKSGGRARRSAIMAMFNDTHPDLLKFITIKDGEDQKTLRSMNLSVAASDKFMEAVKNDEDWDLIGVKDEKVKSTHKARDIFMALVENNWKSGDPGIWFVDRANEDNPLHVVYGKFKSTNPCGEQALLPYQSCALASINYAAFVDTSIGCKIFDYDALAKTARIVTRFIDNLIDVSGFPTPDFEKMAKDTRPIGVGFMGLADALAMLGVAYDSEEGVEFAAAMTATLTGAVIDESRNLALEKGEFPAYREVKERNRGEFSRFIGKWYNSKYGTRNSNFTTIAPTGSISISCDCSAGMEPYFGLVYEKHLADSNEVWYFVNPVFKSKYKGEPWYNEAIEAIAKNHGSCKGLECVPKEVQAIFPTAHDIEWQDRIEMQAGLQKYITNSISSTINLPKSATKEDIAAIYMTAWESGLKGITIYRDGSLDDQPVEFGKKMKEEEEDVVEAEIIDEKIIHEKIIPRKAVKKKRTTKTYGTTHQLMTGHGKVYITVNTDDEGNVIEIFTNGGKGGSVNAGNMEAIARVISIALQNGVELEALASTIENINDGTSAWAYLDDDDEKPVTVISIPDAIGKVLRRFYCGKKIPVSYQFMGDRSVSDREEAAAAGSRCSSCNGDMVMQEGCAFCPSCGDSKCS